MSESIRLSICTDCLVLVANGETPPEMSEDETADYLARVDAGTPDGYHLVPGSCGDGCDGFSWRSCELCSSPLGGDRHEAFLLSK